MPSAAEIIRWRQRNRQKTGHQTARWLDAGLSLFLAMTLALTGIGVSLVYAEVTADLPAVEMLPALLDPHGGLLLQPTQFYDRNGGHVLATLENPSTGDRTFLSMDASQSNYLPPALITATLAVSDPGFWKHSGASLTDINPASHPTLAEKLVSELILWEEAPTLRRALREKLLATQITARYGREAVLTWYLNSADYGRLAYGAEAASRTYFGKPAKELTLAEAAILAATAEAPALNPWDAPQAALQRGQQVIELMLARGMITPEQAEQARQSEVRLQSPAAQEHQLAADFIRLAMDQLGKSIDLRRLERGGFKVITTLDYDLQVQVDCVTQIALARLENRAEIKTAADGHECLASRLLATPAQLHNTITGLGAQTLILEAESGEILAMASSDEHQMGRIHTGGTALMPFVYLTSFTQGMSPGSMLWDLPTDSARDENPDGRYHGPVRARIALANDYLAAGERLLEQTGVENVGRISEELGIANGFNSTSQKLSELLVNSQVSLLELARAYSVLANEGSLVGWLPPQTEARAGPAPPLEAFTILRVEDSAGKVWIEHTAPVKRLVISPQLVYLMTHVLSDEPARWPSLGHPNPLEIGRPAAAKLGYVPDQQSAWAIGYTPDLVAGVWLGSTSRDPRGRVTTEMAAGLWHALIQYASRERPARGWEMPPGVSKVMVCDPSGLLPTADCPTVIEEVFLSGNEPHQADNLYRRLQVNRETGRLATVFTPPELVEERVYMMVPAEALEWARQAGLNLPPESYDTIPVSSAASENAQITSPGMFAYVSGKVAIRGSAGGEGFEFYRLQVGKGLNPQEWIRVGADVTTPVSEGLLGIWDTQGLDGLYAIQLLVVRQRQQVEPAILQVTVDNQPPVVQVAYPSAGEVIPARKGSLILRANASDDLALARVEFYIDNKLVGSAAQAPYYIIWQAIKGSHQLRIKAIDQAGNSSQDSVEFMVN